MKINMVSANSYSSNPSFGIKIDSGFIESANKTLKFLRKDAENFDRFLANHVEKEKLPAHIADSGCNCSTIDKCDLIEKNLAYFLDPDVAFTEKVDLIANTIKKNVADLLFTDNNKTVLRREEASEYYNTSKMVIENSCLKNSEYKVFEQNAPWADEDVPIIFLADFNRDVYLQKQKEHFLKMDSKNLFKNFQNSKTDSLGDESKEIYENIYLKRSLF